MRHAGQEASRRRRREPRCSGHFGDVPRHRHDESRFDVDTARSSAQTLASLAAAGLDDGATGAVRHPMTKAMPTSTPAVVGLERTLHGEPPGRPRGVGQPDVGTVGGKGATALSALDRRRIRVEPRRRFGNATRTTPSDRTRRPTETYLPQPLRSHCLLVIGCPVWTRPNRRSDAAKAHLGGSPLPNRTAEFTTSPSTGPTKWPYSSHRVIHNCGNRAVGGSREQPNEHALPHR